MQRVARWSLHRPCTHHRTPFTSSTTHQLSGLRFASSAPTSQDDDDSNSSKAKPSLWERCMGPDSVVASADLASKGWYRWAMVLPAVANMACIGSPYAWSALTGALTRDLGFVTQAADDWSLADTTMPLSIIFAMHGIGAAAFGKWQQKVGERTAMSAGGLAFGGGLVMAALGIHQHSLPLIYAGYGVLAGAGLGLNYTPPIQALMQWFPDRRGLASGLTVAGFGAGALAFSPAIDKLMTRFQTLPTFLGPADQIETVTRDGRLFADGQEVVIANAADLSKLPYDLAEGVYLVGSGNTGAATALAAMGLVYGATMLASAATIRRPPQGYVPAGFTPPAAQATTDADSQKKAVVQAPQGYVAVDDVMKTPQFWRLFTVLGCSATAGMGMFSVAKPMMTEIFSGALPGLVTAGFAGSYLMMMSTGNLGGRLGFAEVSDRIGRRNTFQIFTLGSIPLYASVPFCVDWLVSTGSTLPLYAFIASTVAGISMMGGAYAVLPAYESDLFGDKAVGAVHGRMLLASSMAALAGPSLLFYLRNKAEQSAIADLLTKADPAIFESTFGAPIQAASQLIQTKTLTVAKLMEIMPAGMTDPSPFMFHNCMFAYSGLMAVAAVAHYGIKPVAKKHLTIEVAATEKKD